MTVPKPLLDAVYGVSPEEMPEIHTSVLEEEVLTSGLTRRQVRIEIVRNGRTIPIQVLMYLPSTQGPHPLIISPNLNGNHSLTKDVQVQLPNLAHAGFWRVGMPQLRTERATKIHRFPIEELALNGYAAASFFYEEAEPDAYRSGARGVRSLYPELRGSVSSWGTVQAWAWSISRVIDALSRMEDISDKRIGLYGFSRIGKAVLLATANDRRVSASVVEGSGKCGAALSRRSSGEPLPLLFARFFHWFAPSFFLVAFGLRRLNIDQDALLAACAPTPLLLSVGKQDWWSDPEGHREAWERARATYAPQSEHLQLFMRAGKHEPMQESWNDYRAFFNTYLKT